MGEKQDLMLEAFTDFLNAVEAGIESARQHIKSGKSAWDASKIIWSQAQGSKGSYERSEDIDNPEFKAMVADLQSHGGKMRHEGFFYWVFDNAKVVGRKKK